ncbi:carbohydrate ABC transporter membrane protein 1, CUT1 family [Georgenia satyanarayanai]|uniref:Carbohydrate ABC transporter membrane protein 1, CUT1 family n=1 Tax=Georgenia satyanarayanai TaxID=860221 RepID=A0A2Y9C6J4_9MICO|nr:sugar ABC transporter permease [Georgenia satyanarayanai]PYF99311.1 carbohydrate ABC transporter membrane protein 1 (CUT1 family) [Georgenia satyanarayanai]SSA43123.1 carbohydrate ABC transporter membrane protein 1, CUT1 family [Georgenia satyanarayanai]
MTITPVPAPPRRRGRTSARPARVRNTRYAFLVPAAVFFALFSIYPLYTLVSMSLSDVTSATLNTDWVFSGLENFRAGFESGETTGALLRTLVFVLFVTVVGMVGGLAAAIALRTTGWWSAAVLAVMVFVWALPPVVNGSVWKFLLADAGLLNMAARALGLTETALPFLYDPQWALWAVAFVNAWAVIPFNALVFRAALMNISPEVFEAASLDGANRWQEIRHIMIPAARPTAMVLLVLTIVFGFRSFDYIYVMTYGGPGSATTTLPFLGYLQAFGRYDFGLGSATSVITVLLVVVLALVYVRSIRREESES